MASEKVMVNRAPVLTLWAAVVAERLGFDWHEALTLGRAVAGLNAQSKGQRLGIFTPGSDDGDTVRRRPPDEQFLVELMGRAVPAVNTADGVRALDKDKPAEPGSVQRYLERKFGEHYHKTLDVLRALAQSRAPTALADEAYRLYEQFRPEVPEGAKGWGALGALDLDAIRALGKGV
jgi:hypothetical protein